MRNIQYFAGAQQRRRKEPSELKATTAGNWGCNGVDKLDRIFLRQMKESQGRRIGKRTGRV